MKTRLTKKKRQFVEALAEAKRSKYYKFWTKAVKKGEITLKMRDDIVNNYAAFLARTDMILIKAYYNGFMGIGHLKYPVPHTGQNNSIEILEVGYDAPGKKTTIFNNHSLTFEELLELDDIIQKFVSHAREVFPNLMADEASSQGS